MSSSVLADQLSHHALMHPDYGERSFLGLIRSLRDWCLEKPGHSRIGEADHVVFLLIDGLGESLLRSHGSGSFLARHQVDSLSAVYPSTTTVALTTLATAEAPSRHGMPGWWTYLSESDLSTTPLPFTERFGGRPLSLTSESMWPLTPWMSKTCVPCLVLSPDDYCDSVFTRYLSAGQDRRGYSEASQCLEMIQAHQAIYRRSFVYVYWPQFDSACHRFGCDAQETASVFRHLDSLVEQMATGLGPKSKLLVSADHGLLDIMEENRHIVTVGDPLLDCLLAPPSGEPRNPVFHLKEGYSSRFKEQFGERFSECFRLVRSEELESLLGGNLSAGAIQRFGDFVGVAVSPAVLHFRASHRDDKPSFIGYHGGLTAEEMRIPLISVAPPE